MMASSACSAGSSAWRARYEPEGVVNIAHYVRTFALAASLGACHKAPIIIENLSDGPVLVGPLDAAKQRARFAACQDRAIFYRSFNVWSHGDVKPAVVRAAWNSIGDYGRSEIFDIAACIASAGQVEQRIVTVVENGIGPEIETRRVNNDRDFAAEAID